MNIRVIQWNISFKCNPEKIAELLSRNIRGYTIINLQEVLETTYSKISSLLCASDSAYSLDFRKAGAYEGKNRKMGVATFVFGGRISCNELVSRSVFPERALFSKIKFQDKDVSVLNFHSLTGVDYKKAKSSNFASIADYIHDCPEMDFFTCDANEPKVDSLNDEKIEFWNNRDKGFNAGLLFGKTTAHSMHDAYKTYLSNNNIDVQTTPLAI